jgi:hypothetical protein
VLELVQGYIKEFGNMGRIVRAMREAEKNMGFIGKLHLIMGRLSTYLFSFGRNAWSNSAFYSDTGQREVIVHETIMWHYYKLDRLLSMGDQIFSRSSLACITLQ